MKPYYRKNAFTLVELLSVIAIIGVLIALLLPAVQAAREAARKNQCAVNMTQMVIAVKAFEEIHGTLPAGTRNDTGPIRNVPLGNHIGWIPQILPFLEQVPLYEQIDFSKGVYDKANELVWLSVCPPIFSCPSDGFGRHTAQSNFKACHSGIETPIDADNNGVFFLNSKLRSKDIADGTSYTVFVGEAMINPSRRTHYGAAAPMPIGNYPYLGWMSGTPGTIRNTGHKPNGEPYAATWAMPFNSDGKFEVYTNAVPYPIDRERAKVETDSGAYVWRTPTPVISFSYLSNTQTWDADEDAALDSVEEGNGEDEDVIAEAGSEEFATPALWSKTVKGQFLVGGFSGWHAAGGVNHAFGDGSVRTLFDNIDLKVYSHLGQRNDHQVVVLE